MNFKTIHFPSLSVLLVISLFMGASILGSAVPAGGA